MFSKGYQTCIMDRTYILYSLGWGISASFNGTLPVCSIAGADIYRRGHRRLFLFVCSLPSSYSQPSLVVPRSSAAAAATDTRRASWLLALALAIYPLLGIHRSFGTTYAYKLSLTWLGWSMSSLHLLADRHVTKFARRNNPIVLLFIICYHVCSPNAF